TFPNLLANDATDSAQYCLQYKDSKGRIHTADEVMYIDTLGTSTNQYGCESTAYHYAFINSTYEHTDSARICDGASYRWIVDGQNYKNDAPVTASTDYTFDKKFESSMGCDSVMHLVLTVDPSLKVRFAADTFDYCPDYQVLELPYNMTSGIIDTVTLSVESSVEPFVIGEKHPQFAPNVPVSISLSNDLRPDVYEAYVDFSSELCHADPITVPFKTRYPAKVLVAKDGFIALLNSEYNGGYHWSFYQWYCNDEPIPGATQSYLPVSMENVGNWYYVGLVREGETEVFYTCPIQYNGSQTDMDEVGGLEMDNYSKYIYNGHLYIIRDRQIYDALGRIVILTE
ncbi:MAG: hypothetical protein MJZ82_05975, partial [Paludibacteraceae bacterium]|nr:hypothetical protein [Paludibacteraceae bacterium]